jgi:hypothetical protein
MIRASSAHTLQDFDVDEYLWSLIFGGEGDLENDPFDAI